MPTKRARVKKLGSNVKRQLCWSHLKGENCYLILCPYAHTERELHLPVVPVRATYKLEACTLFDAGKFCPLGAACTDIHGDELVSGVCRMFAITGRCYFPNDCPFQQYPASPAAPYYPNLSKHLEENERALD